MPSSFAEEMQESGRSARRACVSLLMAKTSPRQPKNGSVAPMPPASNTGFEHLSGLPKGSSVEPEPRRNSLSEPSVRKGGAAAAKAEPSQKGGAVAALRRPATEAAAKPEPSQAQSAIAARMAQQPTIAVRGSCSSPAASSGGAGAQAAPRQTPASPNPSPCSPSPSPNPNQTVNQTLNQRNQGLNQTLVQTLSPALAAGDGKVPAALAPRKGGQLYTPPKDLVFLYPPVTLPALTVT